MGWLRKKSLSERHARDVQELVSSAALEAEAQDVFSGAAASLRKRSKSFSGVPSAEREAAAEEVLPLVRRHQSLCLPHRRRGTKVVGPESPQASLLGLSLPRSSHAAGAHRASHHPADRTSVVSTIAVTCSPPGSLGSEVPPSPREARGEEGAPRRASPAAPATLLRHGSDVSGQNTSRPATAASRSTRYSAHSVIQVSSSYDIVAAQGRRCSTQNFFRGDIKSSRHQLHKASVAALRSRASGPGGLRAAYRVSRDSMSSGGTRSPGRLSWASAGGSVAADAQAASQNQLGGAGGRQWSQSSSILERLRATLSPANIRRTVLRQSSADMLSPRFGEDATRMSVATGASDMQSMLSMGAQVLDAATLGMRDEYQRSAIQAQLDGDNLNRRVAWMSRVVGSLYVDDDMLLEDECDAHKNEVMFHPNSPFRARWDILVVLVIVYQVAVMPVRVVWGDNQIGILFGLEMVLSLLLLADVVLSFHTGWENDGDIVMDKSQVRRHYLTTWCVPELISSLPYDILALYAHTLDPLSYRAISFRAVRFLGLLRWPRLWRYITKWQELLSLDGIVIKLAKYVLVLVMFIHSAGCLAALQAFLQRNNPGSFFNRTNCVSPPGDPPALINRGPFVQYTYALFRSTSGLLATGWGMSPPTSIEEVWFCLVMEFVGSLLQLTLQAAILALVRTYDRSTSNYMQRTEMVKDFFSRYRIPVDVRKRTMTQLLARHTNRRLMRDDFLLRDMAPSMRVDLQQHLASSVLRLTPIFSTWRPVVTRAVAAELVQGIFAPGDTIFFKGEMADCMYFVAEGVVRIVDPDSGRLLTTMTRGGYFGEFALLQGERGTRTASAEAATMCLLFSLSRRTFYRIAAHYPEVADSLNIVAAARTAVNSNQSVNAEELLRIKASRASFLMNTCRAAVAQAILEEDEGEVEAEAQPDDAQPPPGA